MRKLVAVLGACFCATGLLAAQLQIVEVSAPNINCFFSTNCQVSGHDVIGGFNIPHATGVGFLTSRTYLAQPGTPLMGFGAYVYRVDATQIKSGPAGPAAIQSVTIPFTREIIARDYAHTGMTNGQVWMITRGGSGNVKVTSAVSTPTNITFTFNPPIRCAAGTNAGQSSYFFGLVSSNLTQHVVGQIHALVGSTPSSINVSNVSPHF